MMTIIFIYPNFFIAPCNILFIILYRERGELNFYEITLTEFYRILYRHYHYANLLLVLLFNICPFYTTSTH